MVSAANDMQVIGDSGWAGSIAVYNGYIYLANAAGQLLAGPVGANVTALQVIGQSGWAGSIAVSDDAGVPGIYLANAAGQLLSGLVGASVNTVVVGTGGWTGSIAIDTDGWIYLANAAGQLRQGMCCADVKSDVIGPSGWNGSIAVDNGFGYLANAAGELRRGSLSFTTTPDLKISWNVTPDELLAPSGWNGSIAIDNGFIYLATPDGRLLRRSVPTAEIVPTWSLLPSLGMDIGASTSCATVWMLGANANAKGDYGLFVWNGSSWESIVDGAGVRIAVDYEGQPWVVNSIGQIYQYAGGWVLQPGLGNNLGPGKDIGAGPNGSVWVLGANANATGDYGVFKWNGASWDSVSGCTGVQITVGSDGQPWVVNSSCQIYRLC